MAKRKPKTRNIYVTKEPDWKKYIGITDPEEQLKAYREVDYFVHSEVNTKDAVACYKKWVKTATRHRQTPALRSRGDRSGW